MKFVKQVQTKGHIGPEMGVCEGGGGQNSKGEVDNGEENRQGRWRVRWMVGASLGGKGGGGREKAVNCDHPG